jgi:hypothetical protein
MCVPAVPDFIVDSACEQNEIYSGLVVALPSVRWWNFSNHAGGFS